MEKFNQWTQLFDCKELNAIQLRVLLLILNYHNIDNWDNTSLNKLKTDSGAAINTVAKSVKELEDKGLIKTVISSYKKSFKPTYDYLPQYEAIQKLINDKDISKIDKCDKEFSKLINDNHISNNDTNIYQKTTKHISKIDNKYNTINKTINKTKEIEKENRKEKPENPVNGNQKSNFISDSDFRDFKDSPNNLQKENEVTDKPKCDSPKSNCDSKSKPYRVNLNYIDSLEQQFNGYSNATSPNAEDNPKGLVTSANPNLTSDYIKSLCCVNPHKTNPSIMFDLVEASKQPILIIDAMDKSIEWLRAYRDKGMNYFIAQVYVNASNTINSKNGMSEKKHNYATDRLANLKNAIIACGGREMIQSA